MNNTYWKIRNRFIYYIKWILDRFSDQSKKKETVVNNFHNLYYDTWFGTKDGRPYTDTFQLTWLGTSLNKCPLDLWIYQEIMFEINPELIIECGTFCGGSAKYFASIFNLMGSEGKIITIDINASPNCPQDDRIIYLQGSSTSPEIVRIVQKEVEKSKTVLVCLDSDHSKDHVQKELNIYSNFVTVGSYLIVEDTNINGHPVYLKHGPGPMEALVEFLQNDQRYTIDKTRERLLLTMNPNGYLKRIK